MYIPARVRSACSSVKFIALFIGFYGAGAAPAMSEGITLARDGQALFSIVVPGDAIESERTAADVLRKYLSEVTGAEFAVLPETEDLLKTPCIVVGSGEAVQKLYPDESWAGLGQDGIVIKASPERIVLSGGRPRGSIYAVFQFLEDQVGCRWWTPKENFIPRKPELTISGSDLRYVPAFSYREHFTTSTRYHPEFATILRENGNHQSQSSSWGGHYRLLGFAHTFCELLPPERYFADHPEWYTDQGNQNRPSGKTSKVPDGLHTQLCLSNPEVLKELTKNALALIRKNPDAGYISISQNDNSNFCQCQSCKVIAEREGSESGAILRFVNAVAAEVGREFPSFWVETLAYTYSETPPRLVKPAKNVVIRLALALADYGHPIDSEWNAPARKLLLSWAKIAPHLFIWSYATNFKRTMFPHPNWTDLANDLRFYAAHNVQGMFVQGDCYTGDVGDFPQLRAWLMGKLLWDPNLDQNGLTKEFLTGYYGAAGPFLHKYIELITSSFQAQKRGLNTNNRDFSFVTLDVVTRGRTLFAQAREAVADDPVLLSRVKREELSFTISRIARDRASRNEAADAGVAYPSPSDVDADVEKFVTEAKHHGLELWGENVTLEQGIADMRRTATPALVELPTFAKGAPRTSVIDFQPEMLSLGFPGILTEVRSDQDAAGGKTAVMKTDSSSWLVQAQLGPYLDVTNQKWRIYAMVKSSADSKGSAGRTAFEGGIFDDSDMKHVERFTVDLGKVSSARYSALDLGVHRLTPGMFIWFAPIGSQVAKEFLFERILLIKETSGQ